LKCQREECERAQKVVASFSVKLEQAMRVGSIPQFSLWGRKKQMKKKAKYLFQ
jgi:hypothetical protein